MRSLNETEPSLGQEIAEFSLSLSLTLFVYTRVARDRWEEFKRLETVRRSNDRQKKKTKKKKKKRCKGPALNAKGLGDKRFSSC